MRNSLRIIGKALRLLRTARYRRALRLRVGAAIEHEALLRGLGWLGIERVLDVGANVGQFTLVARECLPAASVIAFEPLATAAARFRRVHAGDPRVELVEAALAPESGSATLHVSRAADSSSLLPIGPAQVAHFPGTGESHTETVRRTRLEDVVAAERMRPATLLKIDVQGFELDVLKGCERRFEHVVAIYVECSFIEFYAGQALADEVITWLQSRGYRLSGIGAVSPGPAGVAVQCDLLFLRADLAAGRARRVMGA